MEDTRARFFAGMYATAEDDDARFYDAAANTDPDHLDVDFSIAEAGQFMVLPPPPQQQHQQPALTHQQQKAAATGGGGPSRSLQATHGTAMAATLPPITRTVAASVVVVEDVPTAVTAATERGGDPQHDDDMDLSIASSTHTADHMLMGLDSVLSGNIMDHHPNGVAGSVTESVGEHPQQDEHRHQQQQHQQQQPLGAMSSIMSQVQQNRQPQQHTSNDNGENVGNTKNRRQQQQQQQQQALPTLPPSMPQPSSFSKSQQQQPQLRTKSQSRAIPVPQPQQQQQRPHAASDAASSQGSSGSAFLSSVLNHPGGQFSLSFQQNHPYQQQQQHQQQFSLLSHTPPAASSYEASHFGKRARSGSVSGRLRSASEYLEEKGLLDRQTKSILKDLIIIGDEELQVALDRYETVGDASMLEEMIVSGALQNRLPKDLDILGDLDLDFLNMHDDDDGDDNNITSSNNHEQQHQHHQNQHHLHSMHGGGSNYDEDGPHHPDDDEDLRRVMALAGEGSEGNASESLLRTALGEDLPLQMHHRNSHCGSEDDQQQNPNSASDRAPTKSLFLSSNGSAASSTQTFSRSHLPYALPAHPQLPLSMQQGVPPPPRLPGQPHLTGTSAGNIPQHVHYQQQKHLIDQSGAVDYDDGIGDLEFAGDFVSDHQGDGYGDDRSGQPHNIYGGSDIGDSPAHQHIYDDEDGPLSEYERRMRSNSLFSALLNDTKQPPPHLSTNASPFGVTGMAVTGSTTLLNQSGMPIVPNNNDMQLGKWMDGIPEEVRSTGTATPVNVGGSTPGSNAMAATSTMPPDIKQPPKKPRGRPKKGTVVDDTNVTMKTIKSAQTARRASYPNPEPKPSDIPKETKSGIAVVLEKERKQKEKIEKKEKKEREKLEKKEKREQDKQKKAVAAAAAAAAAAVSSAGDDEMQEEHIPGSGRPRALSDPNLRTSLDTFGLLEVERPEGWVGAYSPESRKVRIDRFLKKRNHRVWTKTVKYDVRKNFADSRLRVKGRFVKKEDEVLMRELMSLT